jgi:hypothetical protein
MQEGEEFDFVLKSAGLCGANEVTAQALDF